MKYSIVMPYLNRFKQLKLTLDSFEFLYKDRDDFEVIIVQDEKDTTIFKYMEYSFLVRLSPSLSRGNYNPAPLFNQGVSVAVGDIIILTSPEILHTNDILKGLDEVFVGMDSDLKYVLCGCKSQGTKLEWYQHSVHRNKQYHFCSAMSKRFYLSIGGFDDRYGQGIAYEDDDFIKTINQVQGIEIVYRDDLIAYHQYHDKISIRVPGYSDKLLKNKHYYERKWREPIAL